MPRPRLPQCQSPTQPAAKYESSATAGSREARANGGSGGEGLVFTVSTWEDPGAESV
jgi:hypothetical protein